MKPSDTFSIGLCVWILSSAIHAQDTKQPVPATSDDPLQTSEPYTVPRVHGQVVLDGLSQEPAWEGIAPLRFVEHRPDFGQPPTEKTEVLIAYDDDYLYVVGRLYDTEPDKIQSNSKKRDSGDPSSEWFGIALDTFNDKENALAFFTTPTGLRWDATIFNDAQQNSTSPSAPMNISWNTFWDVAVRRNDEGWFTEMRIPFSSLRFQDKDGRVVMGLISWRLIARKNECVIFPAIPPNWGFLSRFKPSKAQEIVFENIYSRKPLYIAPYLLGGIGQSFERNDEETAYQRIETPEHEIGLDMKYGLTNNLTLDVTLNTDFAQVEADDEQINLTRFSLFFPEKRLFFQERSSNFDFNFGGPNRLFYSRRIGIEDGIPVRIYGGARLVGRVGSYDVGILNMQTAAGDSLPSENFGVLRLRKRVLNPYSYVGGMTTSRIGADGSYNVAYGLDGIFRLSSEDYLSFKWAQTFETGRPNNPLSLRPTRLWVNYDRRTQKGFGCYLIGSYSGSHYNPGIGFNLRDDFTCLYENLRYGWLPETSGLFHHQVFLEGQLIWGNATGALESSNLGLGWEAETRSGYMGKILPMIFYESVPDTFPLSDDVHIPEGSYTFAALTGTWQTPDNRPLFFAADWHIGSFYDGWRFSLAFTPRWSVSSSLEIEATLEWDRIDFSNRNQVFNAHIERLRFLYMLSTKCCISAFVQYNSEVDQVIENVRFRYNPREGVDLYLVYNESLNTDRHRETPVLPFTDNRTVLLKVTHTFTL